MSMSIIDLGIIQKVNIFLATHSTTDPTPNPVFGLTSSFFTKLAVDALCYRSAILNWGARTTSLRYFLLPLLQRPEWTICFLIFLVFAILLRNCSSQSSDKSASQSSDKSASQSSDKSESKSSYSGIYGLGFLQAFLIGRFSLFGRYYSSSISYYCSQLAYFFQFLIRALTPSDCLLFLLLLPDLLSTNCSSNNPQTSTSSSLLDLLLFPILLLFFSTSACSSPLTPFQPSHSIASPYSFITASPSLLRFFSAFLVAFNCPHSSSLMPQGLFIAG